MLLYASVTRLRCVIRVSCLILILKLLRIECNPLGLSAPFTGAVAYEMLMFGRYNRR